MKRLVCTLLLYTLAVFTATAQCDMYFPLTKGASYELSIFNAKEKPGGTITYHIVDVRADGKVADMTSEMKDEKGKPMSTSAYTVQCNGTDMQIDMKAMIPAQTLEGYKNMDLKASGDNYLVLPGNLTVGAALPDAKSTWEVSSQGSTTVMTTLNIFITNRKVEGKETATTPAGTFDCFKITSDMLMETKTFGLSIPINMKSAEYFAPGTGLVKSLSFKNDKPMGSTVLSKITK